MRNGERKLRKDHRGDKYPLVDTGLNYCVTPLCQGAVNRKQSHNVLCNKCRHQRWRIKNPLRYQLGNLRRRAKQRGHEFSITFEQFKAFAERTDYMKHKGKTALSLSIHRKDNSRGYHADNIDAVSLSLNSKLQRRQFVPFFAHQVENQAYKPSERELAEVSARP